MSTLPLKLNRLLELQSMAPLQIKTFGTFEAVIDGRRIVGKTWGRDKTVQLLQFFITNRSRKSLHKEQIIDRLWEVEDADEGNRDFKVALHGIHKILEPKRKPRTDPKYITRQGNTYQLNQELIWIDAQVFEDYISLGNEAITENKTVAISSFREAINLYQGIYLPNRVYEDWTSEERERLNVLALGTCLSLAELVLEENPLEALHLASKAIALDPTWEEGYQMQMRVFLQRGNRPGAIKAYRECVKILDAEFGLDPLPETQRLFDSIMEGVER